MYGTFRLGLIPATGADGVHVVATRAFREQEGANVTRSGVRVG